MHSILSSFAQVHLIHVSFALDIYIKWVTSGERPRCTTHISCFSQNCRNLLHSLFPKQKCLVRSAPHSGLAQRPIIPIPMRELTSLRTLHTPQAFAISSVICSVFAYHKISPATIFSLG